MNEILKYYFHRIVRIIIFAPFFAIFNFFSVWFYEKSWILEPIPEIYETFALVSMFYLLVVYVAPEIESREAFFQHLQRFGRKNKPKHNRGSLRWFQVRHLLYINCTEQGLMKIHCEGHMGVGFPDSLRQFYSQHHHLDPQCRAVPPRLHRIGCRHGHQRHQLRRHIHLRIRNYLLRAAHER